MKTNLHIQATIDEKPEKQECVFVEECKPGEKIEPLNIEELKIFIIPIYENTDYWRSISYGLGREPNRVNFNADVRDSGIIKLSNWVLYDKELSPLLDSSYKTWAVEVITNDPYEFPKAWIGKTGVILPKGLYGIRRFFYFKSKHSVPEIFNTRPSKKEVKIIRRKKQGKRHQKNGGCVLEG